MAWLGYKKLNSGQRGFVKRVGWIPALALSTLLAGVAPSSNPTLDDKEQNRAYVAQLAEERRAIGDMLTGGFDASWTPSGSAGSREGESSGPLRGDAPELVFTSTNTTMTLTGEDIARGFVMSRVGTGESVDFAPPANATVCEDWRLFGANIDSVYVALTNWEFSVGTNVSAAIRVNSFGRVDPIVHLGDGTLAQGVSFAPLYGALGIVRESRWELLPDISRPCQVWYGQTQEGSFAVTWRNVLFNREMYSPVSFQVEFFTDGRFTYRYDLSRLGSECVSNVVVGASLGELCWTTNALPTNVTSLAFYPLSEADACDQDPDGDGIPTVDELFFYHTDPHGADTDRDGLPDGDELLVYESDPLDPYSIDGANCDGLAAKLGGLDPFSCPEGSTNTVLEHVFYSGTTNGVFVYPESTVDTAVLEIMVSGEGSGRMVVGDVVVPLVAPPLSSGVVANTLLLEVGKGVRKDVWFSKPEGLDVAFASDDLLIGREPSALFPRGWIAFPHTDATIPCIHDFGTCSKSVTLVHGEEFSGLTATWASESGNVDILNNPPIEAEISGHFPKTETRAISYTVDHPSRLNKEPLTVSQPLRFCPRLAEADELSHPYGTEDDGEPDYGECQCGLTGSCSCCGDGWCHCQCANCPCNQGASPTLGPDDEQAKEAYTNIVGGAFEPMEDALYLYGSNTRSVHLDVPEGAHPRCCDCPDHCHSSYVANVYCNRRVAVRDAAGEDFVMSHQPCDVTVFGVSPSRSFADASVLFVTNGATYKRADYTVLGVRFESADGRPDISEYNSRSQSFGYPVHVCTNLTYADSIAARADVLLDDGFVRLSIEGAEGDAGLWLPEWVDALGDRHPAEPLLRNGTVPVRHMSICSWRNIARRYNNPFVIRLKVISSSAQSFAVRFEFVAASGSSYVHDIAVQRISTVRPAFVPDYDRDGSVGDRDYAQNQNGRVLYFWTNQDTWRDDDAFAAYGGYNGVAHPWPIKLPSNGDDTIVNGRNDLVNLCPFAVDLSSFVSKWGYGSVKYKLYVDGHPGTVRFVPISTKWDSVGTIVTKDQKTVDGCDLHSASLMTTTLEFGREAGYELPPEFLALGGESAGVIAMEFPIGGCRNPRLEVSDAGSGRVLFESGAVVHALDVHDMYRWLNLDYACEAATDPKYNDKLAVSWPDYEHADVNVVFVHGYNVHPSEAWDWSQAMFKRLWWAGMDAGFTAVLWRGNESQAWIPKIPPLTDSNCYATPNYHQNVLNAFRTASAFASRVNALPGAKKFMIAHSLGNMLVSASRQFYGLQYEKYFMLNAAVPVEAYDPVDGVTDESKRAMTPAAWRDYPDRVRASHWYELFLESPGDERQKMTWKGIFRDVDNTVNFYSSKDEVVANGDDSVDVLLAREFAWYNQEHARGKYLVSLSPQAGWTFNDYYHKIEVGYNQYGTPIYGTRRYTPTEAYEIENALLMVHPFFKEFRDSGICGDGGSAFLQANPQVWWYSLSHGIPAESFAAGANPVPKWGNATRQGKKGRKKVRNYDMARDCVPAGRSKMLLKWVHSYFIQNSLFDTCMLYKLLVRCMDTSSK